MSVCKAGGCAVTLGITCHRNQFVLREFVDSWNTTIFCFLAFFCSACLPDCRPRSCRCGAVRTGDRQYRGACLRPDSAGAELLVLPRERER